ncbi:MULTISPECIES: M20/M25/M40 family metallo-hydrolase [unclassified Clostridium]|uniref:M20/M25/M40 family metallo-hydrolase n=1 Tax=unclassified Clostridium TaxID=2614128 RepID=UPI000297638D|nr:MULTISPECIES: M20/M25/M40 family metallo-hydrolase [unclassified Clostridium]EKQ58091.1 MAG: arginine degradation protein (putative deacylase) [Clostridium sp. Maddingley MBC34-26]
MFNEILGLTKKLVSIASVNTTPGEHDIACFIESYLRDIPYFKEHPDQVIIQKLKNDFLDRRNVFALIKGEKGKSKDTVILHGHMDTVDVEDFGQLKEVAFDCDELMKKLKDMNLDLEVKEDLNSGDWLFGRGACDMKSGVAVFMVILKHLSEKVSEIDGNILLSVNPVEENLHTGIIEGLEILEELKEKEKLNYIFAINNDYICPLYPGDTKRYVYTGAVGKILPCFYIQGKETHVAQCFEGFDASMVAAELVRLINLNPEYCDGYKGEFTLPPSVLKMKDLKPQYNVQTSFTSFVYFNYFIHNASIKEILMKLKEAAKKALDNVLIDINEKYKEYCNLTKVAYKKIEYNTQVLEYEEVYKLAKDVFHGNIDVYIEEITNRCIGENVDKREIPLEITKKLCSIAGIKIPTIVIFFAAPYCPHNTLKHEVEEEKKTYNEISKIVKDFSEKSNEEFEVMQFFPSLTDSSYLKIDDDSESLNMLIGNFPEYEKLYNVPLQSIKKLNIPAINYGCYGKDAHKWTERVYMPYTFEVLPQLVIKTLKNYLFK